MNAQQLCDGNLGDNIFERGDFGSGTDNVILVDPQIAPGYIYDSSPSPDDGSYTITNNTGEWSFLFGTWGSFSDNSNDPDGYMMVVNASFTPGLFYEELVDDLCENTLYEFSAEILNIVRTPVTGHILPNVTFLIDDVDQFSTGDVPQDETWRKYGFTFTTAPGQTSVKLSLRNNAPGGIGNDLALDNISFQPCGPSAFVTTEKTIFLCEDDNQAVDLTAEIGALDQAIQWQISLDSMIWTDLVMETEVTLVHDIFDVGKYYYRYISAGTTVELSNERCRILSDVLTVDVQGLDYELKDTICFEDSYAFGNQTLTMSGPYIENFVSSKGCDSIVSLDLTVLDREPINLDTISTDPSCFGFEDGSISINVNNGLFPPYIFEIDGVGTTSSIFDSLKAEQYTVIIEDKFGCTQNFDFTLFDPQEFVVSLPNDTSILIGEMIDIEVLGNQDITSLEWLPIETSSCGDCTFFSLQPLQSSTYIVTAITGSGCAATASINVNVDNSNPRIYIPNAMVVSRTSENTNFKIGAFAGLVTEVEHFSVYDRWGNKIHEVNNSTDNNLWDGTMQNQRVSSGEYFYILQVLLIDGNIYDFKGAVTVVE